MKELTIHYEMLLYWSLWKNEWLIMKESMINAWMMNAWMMNAWMMSGFFFFFLLAPILWDWGLGGFVRISASVRWWHTCKPRGIQRTDDCHPIAKGIVGRLSPTWMMVGEWHQPESANSEDQDPWPNLLTQDDAIYRYLIGCNF